MATAGARPLRGMAKRSVTIASFLVAAWLLPASALARSEFDGAWKLDPPTLRIAGGRHTTMSLRNGVYRCDGCEASIINVKADGIYHDMTGDPDLDAIAATVVNDHSIRIIGRRANKVVSTSTYTATRDDKRLVVTFTRKGTTARSGMYTMLRVGDARPGQPKVAGTWKFDHHIRLDDAADVIILKVVGDTTTVGIGGTHASFTATIDGDAVPFAYRSKQGTRVSVQRVGPHSLRETFTRHHGVTLTRTVTIMPDGRTMQMTVHNMRTGAVLTMLHRKP